MSGAGLGLSPLAAGLVIHNSETRRKAPFVPRKAGEVGMYVCGMTVYDYCHIGHARVMVSFDIITRWLRQLGFRVTYVRNITDIDDKIIKRANENGEPIDALTARFIAAMDEDAAALGTLRPDQEPRATDHVDGILAMVGTLVDKGHAYPAKNGDVYYDVSSFPRYGRLSNKKLDDLQAGARVEVDELKSDPLDFVLWKAAKPGEPAWASPWGQGRPGWHIECSAMSTCCLGHGFDIHGGGGDLLFPHHENEIAQSEAATGETYVNTWMHVGFVQVNSEKMSKSLNNFFTIREVLRHYHPEVLRFFIAASHYRSPLNYSDAALDQSRQVLERFYATLGALADAAAGEPATAADYEARLALAMNDDFNTPEAIAVLHELVREANRCDKAGDRAGAAQHANLLRRLAGILGLLQHDPDAFRQAGAGDADSLAQIEALVAEITDARQRKDFQRSDALRDQLKGMGVAVEFTREGVRWRKAD
ncbi:cysteine--tRNA ligase [Amnimonas aquatica]|uniref:Cysteine--tRNA ligase n=1 Tax=Amnimonas aquatica TaxID=2094561 RepID=A0A2P6ASN4_9GAMM|nr:cysteine--tRNA ligase [Amnimonas aquatica]PQA43671.1 cysteine--tRNA ligase [Amnimonas aquatica]